MILWLLVIQHLCDWSYEQTDRFVTDSLILRQFCRLYLGLAPDDTTLSRWANQIQPEQRLWLPNGVTELARQRKVRGAGSCRPTARSCPPPFITQPRLASCRWRVGPACRHWKLVRWPPDAVLRLNLR